MLTNKARAYLDYGMAITIIAIPFLILFSFGFEDVLPILLSFGIVIFSVLTAQELGAFKLHTINIHLVLDCLAGGLLITAPWIFNMEEPWHFFLLSLGILEIIFRILTRRETTLFS